MNTEPELRKIRPGNVRWLQQTCLILSVVCLLLSAPLCHAEASVFEVKSYEQFPFLRESASVSEFEQHIKDYESACLNEFAGSTSGLQCFVVFSLWQREVDFYLSVLNSELTGESQHDLRINQGVWQQYLQNTREMNFQLMIQKYPNPGTVFVYLRAKDAHQALTPIVRERALLLRQWHTDLQQPGGIRPRP